MMAAMGTTHDITHDERQGDTDHDLGGRTAFRTCPLCEAGCGLEITVKRSTEGAEHVTRIRGDREDVFSKGFLCPKGSTLKQLHDDPDRLRRPLVKRDGVHVEVEWAEAWAEVERGLLGVIERHGRESIGVYIGNPNAHNLAGMTYGRTVMHSLGTRSIFSASTVDQMPRQVAAAYVFGGGATVPVPDLDRTDHLVILGANPYASNGSLCTAPDFPGRIEAMRARGGKLVVVDPRRSRTAEEADEWLAIRPGTDALFLASMVQVIAAEGLVRIPGHLVGHVRGLDEVLAACASFTPESVAAATGLSPEVIRRSARELVAADRAAVYGRIGTTTTEFGTTASWLIDVVNLVAGNLDVVGGSMFATPVASRPPKPGAGPGFKVGRGHSRVRSFPEVMGEYPAAAMAEEITTPGAGQLRAMVTIAGNPVLSTPNADQLDAALGELEFMVSVDIYLNETTRHADVILPSPSALQKGHYDMLLLQFAVRNVANFSPPVLPLEDGQPDEWEILAKLSLIAQGQGADADVSGIDDLVIAGIVASAVRDEYSAVSGRDPQELLGLLSKDGRRGPERLLDLALQTGPFGAAFGAGPSDGASLDLLLEHPHGVDFGALVPRLPEVLQTPSGQVELDHPVLMADLERLAAAVPELTQRDLVLVGRRHLRSNNSWMHNIEVLVKGKPRCTLHVHPDDAVRLGLVDGGHARVTSRVGSLDAPVEVTDSVRPGVVSLPHGWGHSMPDTRMRVARERAGVNSNVLADHEAMDPLSGTSVLNGIPVEIVAV